MTRWQQEAEALEGLMRTTQNAERQLTIAITLGILYEVFLDQPARAKRQFEHALGLQKTQHPSVAHLVACVRRLAENDPLSEHHIDEIYKLFDRELASLRNSEAKAACWVHRGLFCERLVRDRAAAQAAYDKALKEVPSYAPAVMGLVYLGLRYHDADLMMKYALPYCMGVDVVQSGVRNSRPPPVPGQIPTFRSTLLKHVLSGTPRKEWNLGLPKASESFSSLPTLFLRRSLHDAGRWSALVDLVSRQAEHALRTSDKKAAMLLWCECSELVTRHPEASSHSAADFLERAYNLFDGEEDREARERLNDVAVLVLERLCNLAERGESKFSARDRLFWLLRWAEVEDANHVRADIYFQAAQLCHNALDDKEQSTQLYECALSHDPNHNLSRNALARIYHHVQAWDKLAQVWLGDLGRTADTARRVMRCIELGNLYDLRLNDKASAIDMFETAELAMPNHPVVVRALDRLYRLTHRWNDVVRLCRRIAEHSQGRAAADAYENAATLLELQSETGSNTATRAQALELVELGLACDPARLSLLHAKARLARSCGKPSQRIDALHQLIELSTEPSEKLFLYMELGQTHELDQKNIEDAVDAYRRAFQLKLSLPEMQDRTLFASLERCYQMMGQWASLAELYELELKEPLTDNERRGLCEAQADLFLTHLNDPQKAAAAYSTSLQIEPAQPRVMTHLQKIHAQQGQWTDWAELEIVVAQNTAGGVRRLARWETLANVYIHELHQPDRALYIYENVLLRDDPEHPRALEAVERILTVTHQAHRLIERLRTSAEAARSSNSKSQLLLLAAGVAYQLTKDRGLAISILQDSLAASPSVEAFHLLEFWLLQENRLDELISLYQSGFSPSEGGLIGDQVDERHRSLLKLWFAQDARAISKQLMFDFESLGPTLNESFELNPSDAFMRENIVKYALQQKATSWLERVDEQQMASLLDGSIATRDPDVVSATRLALIREHNKHPQVLGNYKFAVQHWPSHLGALRGITRVGTAQGRIHDVLEAMRMEAAHTEHPKKAAKLWLEAAHLASEHRFPVPQVVSLYTEALEKDPDNTDASDALITWTRDTELSQNALDTLLRAHRRTQSVGHRVNLALECASRQMTLGQSHHALDTLRRTLDAGVHDLRIYWKVSDYHSKLGQWRESYDNLLRALEAIKHTAHDSTTKESLSTLYLDLATLSLERFGETRTALSHLDALLELEPTHCRAIELRVRCYLHGQKYEWALKELQPLLTQSSASSDKARWTMIEIELLDKLQRYDQAATRLVEGARLYGVQPQAVTLLRQDRYHAVSQAYIQSALSFLQDHPTDAASWHAVLDLHLGSEDSAALQTQLSMAKLAFEATRDISLGVRYAKALLENGEHESAHVCTQNLLTVAPRNADLWRLLRKARLARHTQSHHSMDPHPSVRRATEPLVWLNKASPEERLETVSACSRLTHRVPSRGHFVDIADAAFTPTYTKVSPQALSVLRRYDRTLHEVFRVLSEAWPKLYPCKTPPPGTLPLETKSEANASIAQTILSWTDWFQLPRPKLFWTEQGYSHRASHTTIHGSGLSVEFGKDMMWVLPSFLASVPLEQVSFCVAELCVHAHQGTHVFYKLTPREIEIVLAALLRSHDPAWGEDLVGEEVMTDIAQTVQQALGRKQRARLDELGASLWEIMCELQQNQALPAMAAWVDATNSAARKTALVLSDNLHAAFETLGYLKPELIDPLLSAWASQEAEALRNL